MLWKCWCFFTRNHPKICSHVNHTLSYIAFRILTASFQNIPQPESMLPCRCMSYIFLHIYIYMYVIYIYILYNIFIYVYIFMYMQFMHSTIRWLILAIWHDRSFSDKDPPVLLLPFLPGMYKTLLVNHRINSPPICAHTNWTKVLTRGTVTSSRI